MQKRSVSLVAIVLVMFSLSACRMPGTETQTSTGSTMESAARTVKIGLVSPLTGDIASIGNDVANGARMAVEELNAAGGIGGKQVELVAEDGRCNGADSANAAQKLVNVDKVVAIVGGVCSSETLAIAPIAEAATVVVLSPTSSSPDVTDAGDYVFRNYPSDALKGKALGAYFETKGFKKLAIISENTDFCQGVRSSVTANLPEGTTIVFDEVVDPGTKDYRTLLTRMKKSGFDIFLSNGQSDTTVAGMVRQTRELGMKQEIVGTDTADSINIVKLIGEAAEGLKPLSVPNLDETTVTSGSTAAAFMAAYKATYGDPQASMFFAALAYDAVNVLAKTIGEVGAEGPKIKDALYTMQPYQGVSGTFSFDSSGDVIGIPFAMKEFKGGKLLQAELIPVEAAPEAKEGTMTGEGSST